MKDLLKMYKEMDFSKKEDVDKFVETLTEMKKEYSSIFGAWFGNIGKTFFGEDFDFNTLCDELIAKAKDEYERLSAKANEGIDAIKTKLTPQEPERPSSKLSGKVLKRVTDLAVEYVDTMVKPNVKNLTNEQKQAIYECLIEYSAWMYNHE